jgi:hypothetical protein
MSAFPFVICLYIYIYNSSIKSTRFSDCLLANFRFTTAKHILKFDNWMHVVQMFEKYEICGVRGMRFCSFLKGFVPS